MDLPPELKIYFDMGLGAVSLLLWMRQGKVNKQQVELDNKQTLMIKDHEQRITSLESVQRNPRTGRKRTKV